MQIATVGNGVILRCSSSKFGSLHAFSAAIAIAIAFAGWNYIAFNIYRADFPARNSAVCTRFLQL